MERHFDADSVPNHTTFTVTINGSSPSYGSDIIQLTWVRGLLAATYSLVCVVGAFGNVLVLYYLHRFRHRSRLNSTRYLLMNLAVCDLITLSVYQPLRIMGVLVPFVTNMQLTVNLVYCQLSSFIGYTSGTAEFHTLVAIGVERFLVICFPIRSKSKLGMRTTLISIAFIWILALSSMIPVPIKYCIVGRTFLSDGKPLDICMLTVVRNNPNVSQSWKWYYTSIFVLYYMLPLFVVTYCYGAIFNTLNTSIKELPMEDKHLCKAFHERKSLAKRLLFIAILFILLHTPYFMTFLCMTFDVPVPKYYVITVILCEKLMAINSMLNPFIYCADSRSFFRRYVFVCLHKSAEQTIPTTLGSSSANGNIPLRCQTDNGDYKVGRKAQIQEKRL